jgi:uncharacterized protein YecE (DUF72 family)
MNQNSAKFYLGCAVWSYKGWVGNFYPPKTNTKDFLQLYCEQFSTVEGNTTFYAVPAQKTLDKWCHEMPSGFKFCPKFPRTITHQGLLESALPEAVKFLSTMTQLGDRLGVIFAQLPPNYHPGYLEDLQKFLTSCQQATTQPISLAVEVRHRDWFKEPYSHQLNQLLTELKVGRVLLDTRPIYNAPDHPQSNSNRPKPLLPLQPVVTADFSLVRLISHPEAQYNQTYLEVWVKQVKAWIVAGKTVYFFVHCPQEERSPKTAHYFQNLMAQQGVVAESAKLNPEIPQDRQLKLF